MKQQEICCDSSTRRQRAFAGFHSHLCSVYQRAVVLRRIQIAGIPLICAKFGISSSGFGSYRHWQPMLKAELLTPVTGIPAGVEQAQPVAATRSPSSGAAPAAGLPVGAASGGAAGQPASQGPNAQPLDMFAPQVTPSPLLGILCLPLDPLGGGLKVELQSLRKLEKPCPFDSAAVQG